ncbi:MAG TPA: glutamine amidotransferase [Candidatus Scubalenecus merdavium]|uniref:Lipid II isoglutaminyl synthase (glutamine-hydrolyzing) subunit GatD n=1 Tax=Candidatus Scybalenecus merdavium TaxID=2840939 RepID=A0A9D1SNX8_9FIRM|nr:glutamine amidotransferase [Candidatus Scubalenecus merdavium]
MMLKIAYVYPDLLNLYGDGGNLRCLCWRSRMRGVAVQIDEFPCGLPLPTDYDIYFIGGGQDFEQGVLLGDLKNMGKDAALCQIVEQGRVVLAICGGYQLLGRYYQAADGKRLVFSGALDLYTVAGEKRLIGNFAFRCGSTVAVGFENHAGRTYLGNVPPLGRVVRGFGNNGKDKTEGAHYKNTFGTYAHGPFLPRNPAFADHMLQTALQKKYGPVTLQVLDDRLETNARKDFLQKYIR